MNVPFGNSYIQNWKNHSNLPGKPYIPPTDQQQFAPTSQQQQPLPLSPVEQAILNLSKVVGTIVEEQKVLNIQTNQRIDGKLDNMHSEISKLSNQLLQSSEKEKVHFQRQQYQNMVNEIGLMEDTTTRTDEVKAVVTLRSGREIETVKSSLNKRTDGLQSEMELKLDNLQCSILKLIQQLDHAEEESQEDECLTETILGEQVQLQPQEGLKVESLEAPEELQEAPVNFWPWTKEEEITTLLTEKSSGHETVEGTQETIIQPNPIDLDPNATAQPTNNPLLVPPSADLVYIQSPPAANSKPAAPKAKSNPLPAAPPDSVFILLMPAAQPKPQASTTKATPSLLVLQNIRRLVASVHALATTSKTMATAYIAWHSGWFRCGFGFGTPGPRHF